MERRLRWQRIGSSPTAKSQGYRHVAQLGDGSQNDLQGSELQVHANWEQPNFGWQNLTVGNSVICQQLLGVTTLPEISQPPIDSFCREGDLFANYGEQADDQIQPTLYWRLSNPSGPVLFQGESILSLQTDRLDASIAPVFETKLTESPSSVQVRRRFESKWTKLTEDQTDSAEPISNVVGVRLAWNTSPFSLAIGYQSGDGTVTSIRKSDDRSSVIESKLSNEFLEKGVIRRYRVGFAILPCDLEIDSTDQWYESFLLSEPPLTV